MTKKKNKDHRKWKRKDFSFARFFKWNESPYGPNYAPQALWPSQILGTYSIKKHGPNLELAAQHARKIISRLRRTK